MNITIMGFFSDGERYTFISLTADRRILKSRGYGIRDGEEDLKIVFNFIIKMMETAINYQVYSNRHANCCNKAW
jgi:hypothetical protein